MHFEVEWSAYGPFYVYVTHKNLPNSASGFKCRTSCSMSTIVFMNVGQQQCVWFPYIFVSVWVNLLYVVRSHLCIVGLWKTPARAYVCHLIAWRRQTCNTAITVCLGGLTMRQIQWGKCHATVFEISVCRLFSCSLCSISFRNSRRTGAFASRKFVK